MLVARVSGRPRAVWVWVVLPARVVETPGEVTAQVPAGMPVPVTGGGDSSRSHWPWLVSHQKGRRVVVEVPKDRAWMERDAHAALAVEGLTRPRSYAEQLELEPVKRRLKIPGVDPDVESAEEKWRRAGPRLGELDTPDLDPDEEKTTIVIPEGETRDYYVSQYDARGQLVGRHRQRHVTARAAAPVVGACIASDGGVPDLIVVRRVSGLCAAAVKAGGVDAGLAAVPYFTAHCYSLDDMRPTVPRVTCPIPSRLPRDAARMLNRPAPNPGKISRTPPRPPRKGGGTRRRTRSRSRRRRPRSDRRISCAPPGRRAWASSPSPRASWCTTASFRAYPDRNTSR